MRYADTFQRHIQTLSMALLAMLALMVSPAAMAQETSGEQVERVKPTKEQKRLNDAAVRAIIERDYARAVALLEESLLIGELNVTYYNLASAYEGLGECRKAKRALEALEEAPQARQPPPKRLRAKVEQLQDTLPQECPGPASEVDTTLPPSGPGPDSGRTGQSQIEPPGPPVAAYALFATSFALAGTSIAFHISARSNRQEIQDAVGSDDVVNGLTYPEAQDLEAQANTFDTVAVGTLAASGVALGTGLVLLLTRDTGEQTSARIEAPGVFVTGNTAGLTLRGKF